MSSPSTPRTDPELDGRGAAATQPETRPPVAALPKQRRRPALIGLGVALVALGGLGAAWLAAVVGDTVAVLALRADVARGELIEPTDLTTVDIVADPGLAPVSANRFEEVAGQYATVDLPRGGLVTDGSFATTLLPVANEAMVGVAVTPAQLPSEPLRPGDVIRVVQTPGSQEAAPDGVPAWIEATVVRSTMDEGTQRRVIDVVLPTRDALILAARVATGQVAVVLASRAETVDATSSED